MIECLLAAPDCVGTACEFKAELLALAGLNSAAAGLSGRVGLVRDILGHALSDGYFDIVLADLLWGEKLNCASDAACAFQALFEQASRITQPGARLALFTAAISGLVQASNYFKQTWCPQESHKVLVAGEPGQIWIYARKGRFDPRLN